MSIANEIKRRRTFAIISHPDAGKTTLSEALLYVTGAIRKIGRVDHKNTHLDTNEMEKDRGITIFSHQAFFKAPDAEIVPDEMHKFLEWFNSESTPKDYVKSAIAHLWFVCIHPFDDGNGRIGRAIADMALSQTENSKMRFFSISHQINKDKKQYYDILERTQKGNLDITEWVMWYLNCLLRSVEQSDEILSRILNKTIFWQNHIETGFTDRQRKVLNLYLDGYPGKLTSKNWAKHCKVSPDTAARDIKDLVDKGILVPQQGRVRDVFYGIQCNENILVVPVAASASQILIGLRRNVSPPQAMCKN